MTEEQRKFLNLVAGPALESERTYRIPACVTIAQAVLESGWGKSSLFRLANNPFGIKDRELPEDYGYYQAATTEFTAGKEHAEVARFEKFRSLHDAFACHAALIAGSKRYLPAMRELANWRKFVEALGPKKSSSDAEHCGYSTDPRYAAKLKAIVEVFQLDDRGRLEEFPGLTEPAHAAVEGIDV